MRPQTRAWLATGAFAIAGIAAFFYVAPNTRLVWPDAIFYGVIVLNTFFSIRLFARISPAQTYQAVVDTTLVLCYVALALSLGTMWAFPFFALCIFIAAPLKYILMLGETPYDKLMKKKLLIELLGTALCAFALLGATILDYPLASAWALAIVFSLANVYLLIIHPMYRL
jgi:hypothetical protein